MNMHFALVRHYSSKLSFQVTVTRFNEWKCTEVFSFSITTYSLTVSRNVAYLVCTNFLKLLQISFLIRASSMGYHPDEQSPNLSTPELIFCHCNPVHSYNTILYAQSQRYNSPVFRGSPRMRHFHSSSSFCLTTHPTYGDEDDQKISRWRSSCGREIAGITDCDETYRKKLRKWITRIHFGRCDKPSWENGKKEESRKIHVEKRKP